MCFLSQILCFHEDTLGKVIIKCIDIFLIKYISRLDKINVSLEKNYFGQARETWTL